jgi:hypothetical protein
LSRATVIGMRSWMWPTSSVAFGITAWATPPARRRPGARRSRPRAC